LVVIGGFFSDNQLPNWVYQLINSFASGYAFVRAAAWVAPRGKFPTAIVHTVLVTAFGLLTLVLAINQSGRQSDAWLLLAAAGLLTITGGGVACYAAWEADRGRRSSVAAPRDPLAVEP
jgi:hypothetical protein